MAKMTISDLQSFVKSYLDAVKQAGSWEDYQTSFTGLLDKIGKNVHIDGLFNDTLPELSGDELPLGKTIEEYYIDLTLPTSYSNITTEGAKANTPALPAVEDVVYSYSLGRNKVKTTVPYNDFERAVNSAEDAGNIAAKIVERLQNSFDMARNFEKKQLLGNAIIKCIDAGNEVEIAKPVDSTTGEAFIKRIKADAQVARRPNEDGALSGALIGAAPSLVLYVKEGIMPSIDVDTMAGAFNEGRLAMGVEVKEVADFGVLTGGSGETAYDYSDAYAVLIDPRAVKLHNGYNATRKDENGDGDFINYVKHWEDTAFISKYAFIKAYREPQD